MDVDPPGTSKASDDAALADIWTGSSQETLSQNQPAEPLLNSGPKEPMKRNVSAEVGVVCEVAIN